MSYGGLGAQVNKPSPLILLSLDGSSHPISRPLTLAACITEVHKHFKLDRTVWDVTLHTTLPTQTYAHVSVKVSDIVWACILRDTTYGRTPNMRVSTVEKTRKAIEAAAKRGRQKRKLDHGDRQPKVEVIELDEDSDGESGDQDLIVVGSKRRRRSTSARSATEVSNVIDLSPRAGRTPKLLLPLTGSVRAPATVGCRTSTLVATIYDAVAVELGRDLDSFTLLLEFEGEHGWDNVKLKKTSEPGKGDLASVKDLDQGEWKNCRFYVAQI